MQVMETLRKILFLRKIYARKTLEALLLELLFLALLLPLTITSIPYIPLTILLLFILMFYVARELLRMWIVHKHLKTSQKALATSGVSTSLLLNATNDELNGVDYMRQIGTGESWQLYETTYNFYRRTKSGEYLSKQVYYTVLEVHLSRPVPNLIFDSKSSKGQQFKYLYLKSQKLSFEGDFDKYFTSYAPDHYEIDTLSFITPEVMHKLIDTREYDIELQKDRLILYGPLLEREGLIAMRTAGLALAAEINDNLDNYRDSYLSGNDRLTQTAPFARKLLKSPFRAQIGLALSILALIVLIQDAIINTTDLLFSSIGIFVYSFVAIYGYRVYKIRRDNRQAKKRFTQLLSYQKQRNQKKSF